MDITRRKFFFFGLAAGVGLFLPDSKVEIVGPTWDKTRYDVYDTREDMIKMIKSLEQDKRDNPWYINTYRANRQFERMLFFK